MIGLTNIRTIKPPNINTKFAWGITMRAVLAFASLLTLLPLAARAQFAGGPVPVGVISVTTRPVSAGADYIGRIEAVNKVAIVARVNGSLDQRLFTEGSEVKQGDLLYQLEKGPYQADLASKLAAVALYRAQLGNAKLTLGRAQMLLSSPAGAQATVDTASSGKMALEAQMQGAQAEADAAQINLDYTDIRAPISGRIGRSAITPGNIVGPNSGTLTTIVSQDPMYLTFSLPVRVMGGLDPAHPPAIRVTLPDGSLYAPVARLDFTDVSVTANTDTILMRATIANPAGASGARPLIDGEFVTVSLAFPGSANLPAVPRTALLQDQQGSYVFVVDAHNVVHQRYLEIGATDEAWAAVKSGLAPGDTVVLDGIQKITDGAAVIPTPAAPMAGR